MKEKINNTLIDLKVGKNKVLFIVLGKDGSINRKGNGRADCKDNDLYIGITKEPLFAELMEKTSDELFEFCGKSYDHPEKKGRQCNLKILFNGDGLDTGFEMIYGELSQGPPDQVAEYVINSVKLTEPWFQSMKKNNVSNQEDTERKWWQFWKS